MEVQMIDTRRGVNHRGLVQQYHSGQVCDMPDDQAARFLRLGWATDPNPVGVDAAVAQLLFEKAQARYATNREAWLHCFDYLKASIPAEAYTAICPAILKLTAAFRPQPTRGSAPSNAATLVAGGSYEQSLFPLALTAVAHEDGLQPQRVPLFRIRLGNCRSLRGVLAMRPAFLAWFALLSFTYAMCYEPEPDGYTVADATALSQLIQQSGREPNPGASRRDISELFGREDVR